LQKPKLYTVSLTHIAGDLEATFEDVSAWSLEEAARKVRAEFANPLYWVVNINSKEQE
jgi:hypothetical protein